MDFDKLQEYVTPIMNNVVYDYKQDIDFNRTNDVCVLLLFVEFEEKLLLLKHIEDVNGKFDILNGICESNIPVRKMIFELLMDELEIEKNDVSNIKIGKINKNFDLSDKITYHEIPLLIKLSEDSIIEPYEQMQTKYVDVNEMYNLDLREGLIKKYLQLKK